MLKCILQNRYNIATTYSLTAHDFSDEEGPLLDMGDILGDVSYGDSYLRKNHDQSCATKIKSL